MLARPTVDSGLHATVFKAANCNIRFPVTLRPTTLMDRKRLGEQDVQQTARHERLIHNAPEHLF